MDSTLVEAANLAWFDAAKGWPESLEPAQAVALQCRRLGTKWGDYKRHPDTLELAERLRLAVKAGVVVLKTWTETKMVEVTPQASGDTWPPKGWDSWAGFETESARRKRLGYPTVTQKKEVTHTHITAEAFAAWLAANEIDPSRHVAAWFKAMAVNTDHRHIEPAAGWKAHTDHGLQKFDDTNEGRLVRLADLVQWLMDTRELPCKTAVEAVCSVLEQRPSAAAGWLYLLQRNDFAARLTPEHSFYWLPRNAPADDNPGEPNDNGVAGAINNMRRYWTDCDSPDACKFDGAKGLAPLAIRVDVAHLLWGYGRRVEVKEQTQAAASATSVAAAPAVPVKGVVGMNKEQREDARLDYCIKEGLSFHKDPLRPLPYGIGKVAKKLGMTRPSLSTDVKNALARKAERERPKPKLVTPKK